MASREELVYTAKLAEQAERYDEMVEAMKSIAAMKTELNTEERNLLSVAYKNVIGARRASWRILSSLESRCEDATLTKQYRERVEKELSDICKGVLKVLDEDILPALKDKDETCPETAEAIVFYNKMKGDYYRYMAEFSQGAERQEASENSQKSYKTASDSACKHLNATNPIRLGLALNFSVFYYEILNSPERACCLAKAAFDDSIAELDSLGEDSYKDSTLILQLLRDNLTLWTSDTEKNQEQEGEGEKLNVEDVEGNDN